MVPLAAQELRVPMALKVPSANKACQVVMEIVARRVIKVQKVMPDHRVLKERPELLVLEWMRPTLQVSTKTYFTVPVNSSYSEYKNLLRTLILNEIRSRSGNELLSLMNQMIKSQYQVIAQPSQCRQRRENFIYRDEVSPICRAPIATPYGTRSRLVADDDEEYRRPFDYLSTNFKNFKRL